MVRKSRIYDDDDGRTIADMSGVGHQPVFLPRRPQRRTPDRTEDDRAVPPREEDLLTPQERRWYVLGALKAALLIGLVFIVGLGLVVLLFLWAARMHS